MPREPFKTKIHYANYISKSGASMGPMSFDYQSGGPKRPGVTLKSYYAERDAAIRRRKAVYQRMRTGGINPWSVRMNTGPLNMADLQLSINTITTSIQKYLLNSVTPGDLINNRHGRSIKMSSLFLDLIVQPGSTTVNSTCRVFVVYDMQSNATAPNYTDIFSDVASVGPLDNTQGCTVPRNPSNMDRFKILYNRVISHTGTLTATGPPVVTRYHIKKYIKLRGLETRFNTGTAGTIADIQTGSLYLMTLGDSVATAGQLLSGTVRLNFKP